MQAVFARISDRCELLQLNHNIVSRAQHAYKIVDDAKVVRMKNEQVIIAACISFATRGEMGASRTLQEICMALQVTKKVSSDVVSRFYTDYIRHRRARIALSVFMLIRSSRNSAKPSTSSNP